MLKLARRARGHFVMLIEIRLHLIRVKPGHISQPGDIVCDSALIKCTITKMKKITNFTN